MEADVKKQGTEGCVGKCEGGCRGGACGACSGGSCNTGGCGGGMCGGGMCSGWKFRGHRVIRVLLALIILVVVFTMGFKLGELKGMFSSYGQGGMRGGRSFMMRGYQGGNYLPAGGTMMNGGGLRQSTTTVR